ncbi:MAG TPA: hypothetical protein VMB74_07430 [Streptosporangiaceae bacterium]|nr:hypothetical protein [Streptosporangiaceae bacterium]
MTQDQTGSFPPGHAIAPRAYPAAEVPDRAGNGGTTSATADRKASEARADSRPRADHEASRPAAVTGVLRRHWLAAALLTAGLVLRVLAQLAYRPALFYIDSVKYLYDAAGNDPEGYKAPLRAIAAVSNLDVVVAVQHLLGLGMAVVIYVLLLRRGVPRWLAALAIAPVLLDAYQLQNEQAIMPGTWFEVLIVGGIAILLWKPGVSWRRVMAAGLVLGTSATVAQVGEALIPAAAIFVLVAAGGGWRQAIGKAAVLCVACAVPILAYCTGSYLLTGNFFLSHSGETSLYGRAASAADCATMKLPADERGLCPTPKQQVRGDDWLEYGTYAPVQRYYNTLPRGEVDSLVTNFSDSVVKQQPLRVLDAYLRDVVKVYAVARVSDPGDAPISRWQFQTSFPYFDSHATPAIVKAAVERFGGGLPAVWRPVAVFLRSYQLDGGYTPGPLLLLCTVTGLIGSAFALRRRLPAASRGPALACLLFFAAAVWVILVSDLFVFSWRYQLPALITLVPAGALGITVIMNAISTRHASNPVGGGQAGEDAVR